MTTSSERTDRTDDWERLCSLLEPDPEVWRSVQRTLDASSLDTDPWAALLDALDESGAIACLDTGDTGDLLVDAVTALPRIARAELATGRDVDLRAVVDVDDLTAAIAAARDVLAAVGLDLLALDEGDGDEECLPLVAVARDDVAEITALVGSLGRRLLPLA
ncbi:DUF6630 family protein [Serinibacter arcticus]|uniref:DUF6630 domain-containing protein n=1 Tax=Serinibacter arcticus TaxID=1655435 RepID=A0A4Z1E2W7_9MICO|nr:hypothetical protein [Serinibacter arcticus]TGO05328.1 hypothetical protein SERN_1332 [Serinibacter arcticus]